MFITTLTVQLPVKQQQKHNQLTEREYGVKELKGENELKEKYST